MTSEIEEELYLLPQWHTETGNGGYGQFLTRCSCSQRGIFSLLQHMGPSYGRQFSMNFSNMSPAHRQRIISELLQCGSLCHGVQSCKGRLLQCGSPTVSQVLPGNLLQHGLLFPQVCRFLLQCGLPMRSQPPLRHPPAPAWFCLLHGLQVDPCIP